MRLVISLTMDPEAAELLADALKDKWQELSSQVEVCKLAIPGLAPSKPGVEAWYQSCADKIAEMYKAVEIARKLGKGGL